jgi:hypothetical protein
MVSMQPRVIARTIATAIRESAPDDWVVELIPGTLSIRATRIRNHCMQYIDFTFSGLQLTQAQDARDFAKPLLAHFKAQFATYA